VRPTYKAWTLCKIMMQFESMEENHGPADAAAVAKLAAYWNSVPGTRQEAFTWVEHVWAMTKMMLGDECEANQYLPHLGSNLCQSGPFAVWSEIN
jgi:hypothetical protein